MYARTLSGAELNYLTTLLGVLDRRCHGHKNLEYSTTTYTFSRRQARWSEYLSACEMVVRFA